MREIKDVRVLNRSTAQPLNRPTAQPLNSAGNSMTRVDALAASGELSASTRCRVTPTRFRVASTCCRPASTPCRVALTSSQADATCRRVTSTCRRVALTRCRVATGFSPVFTESGLFSTKTPYFTTFLHGTHSKLVKAGKANRGSVVECARPLALSLRGYVQPNFGKEQTGGFTGWNRRSEILCILFIPSHFPLGKSGRGLPQSKTLPRSSHFEPFTPFSHENRLLRFHFCLGRSQFALGRSVLPARTGRSRLCSANRQ